MPLKINVKSGEKFVVNGAVMVAGNKGASLVLQNEATILLGKDVMQEREANTPSRRIYFSILVMYLDQENVHKYRDTFMSYVEALWMRQHLQRYGAHYCTLSRMLIAKIITGQ